MTPGLKTPLRGGWVSIQPDHENEGNDNATRPKREASKLRYF